MLAHHTENILVTSGFENGNLVCIVHVAARQNNFQDGHLCFQFLWWYHATIPVIRAGIAQWLEHQTHDRKVTGSNPCRSGRRILFSRVNFLCWLLLQYQFHPCVTTVACKRSQSFCQKCRWQVTAKHAYILHTWLCMKWHGAWLYGVHRTCAETAAVSCGTSHTSAVNTPLWWIFKKMCY